MQADAHYDPAHRLQVAIQRLDEMNREFRQKLPMFAAAGHGPYPTVEEWQRRWELQATIDRLRVELGQFTTGSAYAREGLGNATMPIVARDRAHRSYAVRANRPHW